MCASLGFSSFCCLQMTSLSPSLSFLFLPLLFVDGVCTLPFRCLNVPAVSFLGFSATPTTTSRRKKKKIASFCTFSFALLIAFLKLLDCFVGNNICFLIWSIFFFLFGLLFIFVPPLLFKSLYYSVGVLAGWPCWRLCGQSTTTTTKENVDIHDNQKRKKEITFRNFYFNSNNLYTNRNANEGYIGSGGKDERPSGEVQGKVDRAATEWTLVFLFDCARVRQTL